MSAPDVAPAAVETRDAPPAAVARWAAALMLGLALFAGMVWLTADFSRAPIYPNQAEAGGKPAPPRLQASPATDAAAYHAAMDEKLRGYGWTDRAHGVARIPVEAAMDILAEQGWPKEASP